MDDIRKNILREQEMRKARLSAHFGQAFSANGTVNEDGRTTETTATKSAKEVKGEVKRQSLIKAIGVDSVEDAIEILKAKHQDGDMHPNGKWVWVSFANGGKEDWRTKGGRTHKKHTAATGGSTSQQSDKKSKQSSPYQYASATSTEEAIKGGLYNSNMSLEDWLALEPSEMSRKEREDFYEENGSNVIKKLADVRKVVEAADREVLATKRGYSVNQLEAKQKWARSELKQGRVNRAMAIMYEWLAESQERRKLFFSQHLDEARSHFAHNYKHKHPKADDSKINSLFYDTPTSKLLRTAMRNAESQYDKAFEQMAQYAKKQTEDDAAKNKPKS